MIELSVLGELSRELSELVSRWGFFFLVLSPILVMTSCNHMSHSWTINLIKGKAGHYSRLITSTLPLLWGGAGLLILNVLSGGLFTWLFFILWWIVWLQVQKSAHFLCITCITYCVPWLHLRTFTIVIVRLYVICFPAACANCTHNVTLNNCQIESWFLRVLFGLC